MPQPRLFDQTLTCLGAGEQYGHPPWFRDRRLGSHGLVYVSSGRGTYVQTAPFPMEVAVDAPSVIWLFPGVQHGYGPDRMGWSEHWMLFSGVGAMAYESLGGSRVHPVISLTREPSVAELFGKLRSALAEVGQRSDLTTSVLAQRILLELHDAGAAGQPGESSLVDRLAERAFESIPMAARARLLGLTTRQLRMALRESIGLNPMDILIEIRLSRAQELLAETSHPVTGVAHQVGYDDAAYFSRLFTQRVGVPPSTFRREHQRATGR